MGRRHTADELLAAAGRVVERDGLLGVTFGSVAAEAATNDRTVVYYFPSKTSLLEAVTQQRLRAVQALLAKALGADPMTERELARRAWPVLASAQGDRLFATFFELAGLAAAGRDPFPTMAAELTRSMIDWVAGLLVEPEPKPVAAKLVAALDGALLLRHVAGPKVGRAAAAGFGWID